MATLKDIARKAGVSIGTVDRIIHQRGRYSRETADRVRRIMVELDYRPNVLARSLSQGRNCRIAAFLPLPGQDSGYWELPLAGMNRASGELMSFGVSLSVFHYDRYDSASFVNSGGAMMETRPDAVLMAPLRNPEAEMLLEQIPDDVPVMFFDSDLPGSRRLGCIGQDSRRSGRLATRLMNLLLAGDLQKQGHRAQAQGQSWAGPGPRRNFIVAPDARNIHLDNRIQGFREGLEHEFELLRVTVESDRDVKALHQFLDEQFPDPPGGLFVADASAHYLAEYLSRREIRVPIVGYDPVPENRRWLEDGSISFLLTQKPAEQGYQGVMRLFRKIFLQQDGPDYQFMPIEIVCEENMEDIAADYLTG